MTLSTRELVVVKADNGLAVSFSAAGRSNPSDRTSAESDFVCEAFFPGEDEGPEKSLR